MMIEDDLAAMSLQKIRDLYNKAAADLDHAKARVAMFSGELARRFKPDFESSFADAKKVSGEITIERDGVKLQGEISKTVKWDSASLMALAANMPWTRVSQLFKVEFSMTETKYGALAGADPELFSQVTAARTVKYGDLKVKPKD